MTATKERAGPLTVLGEKGVGRNRDNGQAEILQTAVNIITARVIHLQIQKFISAVLVQDRPTGALIQCAVSQSRVDTHTQVRLHAWMLSSKHGYVVS